MEAEPPQSRNKKHLAVTFTNRQLNLEEHSPLLSTEVTGQDVPQPDDDTMAAVKTSIVDGVFPVKERRIIIHRS